MNTTSKPDPRRKFPRRRFTRQVGCLADGSYSIGQCLEIGEGGVSIALKTALEIDKSLVVNFQIPDGSFISVRAQVRNIDPIKQGNMFILGCSFENLHFDHKREIRSYVSARSDKSN